jgi:hypothetical protein
VTFRRLEEHIARMPAPLPPEPAEPDPAVEPPRPLPSDATEALAAGVGPDIRIDEARGPLSLSLLDRYLATPVDLLPRVLALSYCEAGCDMGTACAASNSFFRASALRFSDLRARAALRAAGGGAPGKGACAPPGPAAGKGRLPDAGARKGTPGPAGPGAGKDRFQGPGAGKDGPPVPASGPEEGPGAPPFPDLGEAPGVGPGPDTAPDLSMDRGADGFHGLGLDLGLDPFADLDLDREPGQAPGRSLALDPGLDLSAEEPALERLLFPKTGMPSAPEEPGAEAVDKALRSLGLDPREPRHFDCGFCGSGSCQEMAGKIALHVNVPQNCVNKVRRDFEDSSRKITAYIELIRSVSDNLLNLGGGDVTRSVEQALLSLCYSMDAFTASLWRNSYDSEERPTCRRIVSFPTMLLDHRFNIVTMDDPPGWLEALSEGNPVVRSKNAMSASEQKKFLGRNVNSLVLSPIIASGDFWGFLSLLRQEDEPPGDRDLSVLSVCSNLLASFMINLDLKGSNLAMG